MINQLFDNMSQNKAEQSLMKVFEDLASYAIQHFATEERLMQQAGYAELDAHKQEHEAFVKKVGELKSEFSKGSKMTVAVLNFMKSWLLNHIMQTDMKYAPALKAKGLA